MLPPTRVAGEFRPEYSRSGVTPQARPDPSPASRNTRKPFLPTVNVRTSGYLPFSWKLAALGATAVFATLLVLLWPVYLQGRENSTKLHGLRLAVIARSAAISLSADSLDVIGSRGQNTEAFISARQQLRRLWIANDGNEAELSNGIAVVRKTGNTFRFLVHSSWNAGVPQYRAGWIPPDQLKDSIAVNRAGYTSVYRMDAEQLL